MRNLRWVHIDPLPSWVYRKWNVQGTLLEPMKTPYGYCMKFFEPHRAMLRMSVHGKWKLTKGYKKSCSYVVEDELHGLVPQTISSTIIAFSQR